MLRHHTLRSIRRRVSSYRRSSVINPFAHEIGEDRKGQKDFLGHAAVVEQVALELRGVVREKRIYGIEMGLRDVVSRVRETSICFQTTRLSGETSR